MALEELGGCWELLGGALALSPGLTARPCRRHGAHLRERPRQPPLQAAALPGPGAPRGGRRCARWVAMGHGVGPNPALGPPVSGAPTPTLPAQVLLGGGPWDPSPTPIPPRPLRGAASGPGPAHRAASRGRLLGLRADRPGGHGGGPAGGGPARTGPRAAAGPAGAQEEGGPELSGVTQDSMARGEQWPRGPTPEVAPGLPACWPQGDMAGARAPGLPANGPGTRLPFLPSDE